MASPLSASLEVNGESVDNPVRILARVFGFMASVLNDEEVLDASDNLFGALNRATKRYEYALEAPSTRAIEEGNTNDHG